MVGQRRSATSAIRRQLCLVLLDEVLGLPTGAVDRFINMLGITARQLLRTGEDEYKTLNLADENLSQSQLIAAIAAHPKLMERPILETADKAVIGRPPEKILEILP